MRSGHNAPGLNTTLCTSKHELLTHLPDGRDACAARDQAEPAASGRLAAVLILSPPQVREVTQRPLDLACTGMRLGSTQYAPLA